MFKILGLTICAFKFGLVALFLHSLDTRDAIDKHLTIYEISKVSPAPEPLVYLDCNRDIVSLYKKFPKATLQFNFLCGILVLNSC